MRTASVPVAPVYAQSTRAASIPVTQEVPAQTKLQAAAPTTGAIPLAGLPDATPVSINPRSGGSAIVLGAAERNFLTRAIALGTKMSNEIIGYAREHGGSLGQERSRFVYERDHWINSSYDFIREFLGGRSARDFMNGDSPSALDSNGSEAARLVNSVHGRVAVLRKLLGGSMAAADENRDS